MFGCQPSTVSHRCCYLLLLQSKLEQWKAAEMDFEVLAILRANGLSPPDPDAVDAGAASSGAKDDSGSFASVLGYVESVVNASLQVGKEVLEQFSPRPSDEVEVAHSETDVSAECGVEGGAAGDVEGQEVRTEAEGSGGGGDKPR